MRKLLSSIFMVLTPAFVNAAENTVFACTTKEGKELAITKQRSNYLFSYGDVSFTNPIKDVVKNEGSFIAGGSGFVTGSLEMKNSGKSYVVEFSLPRNNLKVVDEATLSISNGGKSTLVECDTNKKIIQNLDKKIMNKSGFSF